MFFIYLFMFKLLSLFSYRILIAKKQNKKKTYLFGYRIGYLEGTQEVNPQKI